MRIQLGQQAPDFSLESHLGSRVTLRDFWGYRNVLIAFFPLAWTPVWTGQIPSYEAQRAEFEGLDTQVLGVSVDSVPTLRAWAASLGDINYPLLSDFYPHGGVAARYGVLRDDGTSERALFVIDKAGCIRYIDVHDIDDAPDNDVVLAALRRIDPGAAVRVVPSSLAETEMLPAGDVIMYCTSWCPACRRARRFLDEHGVHYTEIDINKTPQARDRLRQLTGGILTTPTFEVNGEVIVDFRPSQVTRLAQALNLKLE